MAGIDFTLCGCISLRELVVLLMPLTAGTISNTLVGVCVGLLACRSTDFCECDGIIKLYRSVVEIKSKRSDYRYERGLKVSLIQLQSVRSLSATEIL